MQERANLRQDWSLAIKAHETGVSRGLIDKYKVEQNKVRRADE